MYVYTYTYTCTHLHIYVSTYRPRKTNSPTRPRHRGPNALNTELEQHLHSPKLTWNPKRSRFKRTVVYKWPPVTFHDCFAECTDTASPKRRSSGSLISEARAPQPPAPSPRPSPPFEVSTSQEHLIWTQNNRIPHIRMPICNH